MPQEPLIWIILILAAALVIALALWKGRGLRVSKNREGFSIEVEQAGDAGEAENASGKDGKISVAREARIEESDAGDIAGVKTEDTLPLPTPPVEVGTGLRVKKARVGDIVGVKQSDRRREDQP
ncbi:hypothetical protein [Geoalkalibacter halelectricus]|uniref:hypothetical protein n=1 Tax=Geoalkalibacter halelectricus TaxID=2847045 RepID=UPI003D1E5477